MFVDEIKSKLRLDDAAVPFVVTWLGCGNVIVNGVKTVILSMPNAIKIRVKSETLVVVGDSLEILQLGGGDVYIKGRIERIEIEKK